MKNETQPRNAPTEKSEMKASATAITIALAASPSAGCFTAILPE
jgi:hypothetical protein